METAISMEHLRQIAAARRRRQGILLMLTIVSLIHSMIPSPPSQSLHSRDLGVLVVDTIENAAPATWQIMFRMRKPCFNALCQWLAINTPLPQVCRRDVTLRVKVMIFLYIVAHGASVRLASSMFGRSWETVHRSFHQVLNALLRLAKHNIRMPTAASPPPRALLSNPKIAPFAITGCIGAIDGRHYHAHPPADQQAEFRNRYGDTSFNVCTVVDFSGRFIYMLAGWEGSAHDFRVFRDALARDLHIPEGKYLLGGAGYQNSHRVLTPYRGLRYHFQEIGHAGLRPSSPEELYNLRHNQTRITVENQFATHKGTWGILTDRPKFPIGTQIKIIYATAALTNWLVDHGDVANGERHYDTPEAGEASLGPAMLEPDELNAEENGEMGVLRRRLANEMWAHYQGVLQARGIVARDPEEE